MVINGRNNVERAAPKINVKRRERVSFAATITAVQQREEWRIRQRRSASKIQGKVRSEAWIKEKKRKEAMPKEVSLCLKVAKRDGHSQKERELAANKENNEERRQYLLKITDIKKYEISWIFFCFCVRFMCFLATFVLFMCYYMFPDLYWLFHILLLSSAITKTKFGDMIRMFSLDWTHRT